MLLTKRQHNDSLFAQMKMKRTSFEPHWRDIGEYILPGRIQLNLSDANRGERRNHKIIDGSTTINANILRAGMTSGIASPSSPWFALESPDPEMNKFRPVKRWLEDETNGILSTLAGTTFYSQLPTLFGDTAGFGTSAMLMEEDFDEVARFTTFPIGTFWLGLNSKNRINAFGREFQYTTRQMVEEFGWNRETNQVDWDKLSIAVKKAWENSQYETLFTVRHLIVPNPDFDPRKAAPKFKRYQSTYFELGDNQDKFLRESGYDQFRVMAPRWEAASGDIYGTWCPGFASLGDTKQLQFGELRGAEAVDKMLRPPMKGPASMRGHASSLIPGGITYVESDVESFKPAMEVNFRLEPLEAKQQQIRMRSRQYWYADLFLLTSQSDRRDVTAEEIRTRNEEKLVQLGPVLTLMDSDLLRPTVDNVFEFRLRRNLVAPPPPELQGMPLKVVFTSLMHRAQKLTSIGSLERFSMWLGGLVQQTQDPTHYDKVDFDQYIETYADGVGLPSRIIRSDDEAGKIRSARAEAQQAQSQMQAIREGAGAVKDLAGASLEGNNALRALMPAAGGVQ